VFGARRIAPIRSLLTYFSHVARQVTMVVRGRSMKDTLSTYLVDSIRSSKHTSELQRSPDGPAPAESAMLSATMSPHDAAVFGLVVVAVLFVFSWIGGLLNVERRALRKLGMRVQRCNRRT
jgi:hypothetical protein